MQNFQTTVSQKECCNSNDLKRLVIKVCGTAFGKAVVSSAFASLKLYKNLLAKQENQGCI
jgi:RNase P/RNase MRP subunit POP5